MLFGMLLSYFQAPFPAQTGGQGVQQLSPKSNSRLFQCATVDLAISAFVSCIDRLDKLYQEKISFYNWTFVKGLHYGVTLL